MGMKILLLVLCSLAINLVMFNPAEILTSDGSAYSQIGKNIAEGKGYTYNGYPDFTWPFMTQLLLGGIYALFGSDDLYGIFLMMIFSAMSIIPLYLLSKKYIGEKPAVLASLLFITNLQIIDLSTTILSDIPFIFFFLWFIYLFDSGYYYGSAVFLGLMALTRRTAVAVFIVAFIYFLVKHRWRQIIPFFLIAGFISSSYYMWVYSVTGSPFTTGSIGDIKSGQQSTTIITSEFSSSVQEERMYEKWEFNKEKFSLFDYILQHRWDMLKKYLIQIPGIFLWLIPSILNPLLLLPLLIGVYHLRNKKFNLLSVLFAGSLILLFMATYASQRHLAVILPFLLIYAAYGLFMITDRLPHRYLILFMLLLILLTPSVFSRFFKMPEHQEWRTAGLWMGDNLPQESKVLSRKPQIPYYAGGMKWSSLPMTLNSSLYFAEQYGYDYIIFDEAYTAVYKPDMIDLLLKDEIEDLELVYHDPTPLQQVKIWRIKKDG